MRFVRESTCCRSSPGRWSRAAGGWCRMGPKSAQPDPPSTMQRRIFASLRGYRIEWLSRDLVAGLMLAAIAIPGQLATARLAGMPPETGIYAFVAGSVAFAILGANRFMSVGADSTIAPIFAGGLASIALASGHGHAQLTPLFALLVGVLLVAI